jgi:hypothetical protein
MVRRERLRERELALVIDSVDVAISTGYAATIGRPCQ